MINFFIRIASDNQAKAFFFYHDMVAPFALERKRKRIKKTLGGGGERGTFI